ESLRRAKFYVPLEARPCASKWTDAKGRADVRGLSSRCCRARRLAIRRHRGTLSDGRASAAACALLALRGHLACGLQAGAGATEGHAAVEELRRRKFQKWVSSYLLRPSAMHPTSRRTRMRRRRRSAVASSVRRTSYAIGLLPRAQI